MKGIRNIILMIVAVAVIIGGRVLSFPIIEYDDSYSMKYEEEAIEAGNFGNINVLNGSTTEDSGIKYFINGFIPLAMYLLSVLCLLELIRNTYIKYLKEDSLVYKTILILLLILQMSLIGLISFYVADISYKVMIIWILVAVVLVRIVYEGNYFVDILKMSDNIRKYH